MKPQQIHLSDWQRMLIGEAPWTFLVEMILRSVVIYVVLLLAIRIMGKRVAGQMSASELAVIVTLGAAIGVPMQAPDRGMLPAIIILVIAIAYERGVGLLSFWRRRAEITLQGDLAILLKDGRLELRAMEKVGIARERLFSVLRHEAIEHLGQVERVYVEANGSFSVYRRVKAEPGLSTIPAIDDAFRRMQARVAGVFVCGSCGEVEHCDTPPREHCSNCDHLEWTEAVLERNVPNVEETRGSVGDGTAGPSRWAAAPGSADPPQAY